MGSRPTADQLRFISAANGEQNLDTYMEAVEKGGKSLGVLLDVIFDGSGLTKSTFVELREDPVTAGDLQYRLGGSPNNWFTFTYTPYGSPQAKEWADFDEDVLVSAAAGGNQVDDYSAKHWAIKAATSADTFDDRYLGPKAADPTLDNDGDPLTDGAVYWNTTSKILKFYQVSDTTWYAVGATLPDAPSDGTLYGRKDDLWQAVVHNINQDSDDNITSGGSAGATLIPASALSNLLIGKNAGTLIDTGDDNVALGNFTLQALVSNSQNTAVGRSAGSRIVGDNNSFVGRKSGYAFLSGSNNTGVGFRALGSETGNATGNYNIAIGSNSMAGSAITSATSNIAMGLSALGSIISSNFNIAIGESALLNLDIGIENTAVGGQFAGRAITTGDRNVAIGSQALSNASGAITTNSNIAIGYQALLAAAGTPISNVAIGDLSLLRLTDGDYNIGIGSVAGRAITSGEDNIAIGFNALGDASASLTGQNNIAVGFQAMHADAVSTAENNIAIGTLALDAITTGTDNIAIGRDAGKSIRSSINNIAIGKAVMSGVSNLTGNDNIIIGRAGMISTVLTTAFGNIILGRSTAPLATTANDNIIIGNITAAALTSGVRNVIIGDQAANKITTGGGNVIIGTSAGPISNQSNRLYIDNVETNTPLIHGDFATSALTINGSLTVTGAFESRGIDDNATGERLLLENTFIKFGVSGAAFTLAHAVNNQSLNISGGDTFADGANIVLDGGAHTTTGDMDFRNDFNTWMLWDESVGDFEISTGIGSKTSALTIDASQKAIFSGKVQLNNTNARFLLNQTDAGLDQKIWQLQATSERFIGRILSDDFVEFKDWISVERSGTGAGIQVDLVTIPAPLTVTGDFTSLGIDDNTTGKRLEISDALMQIGTSGVQYIIAHAVDDQLIRFSGGDASTRGGEILLWGGAHSTNANDFEIRADNKPFFRWDESAGDLEILTGIGSKTTALTIALSHAATFTGDVTVQGAFTSLGIDDNATVTILTIVDTIIGIGQSNTTIFPFTRVSNTGGMAISGGTDSTDGANITLMGASHSTLGNDMFFGASANHWMVWDESVGDLEILTGIGSKTSALTIDVNQDAAFAGDVSAVGNLSAANFSGTPGANHFQAELGTMQTVSVTPLPMSTSEIDPDGDYDAATNYDYTPSVAGKYFVSFHGVMDNKTSGNGTGTVVLRKNTTQIAVTTAYCSNAVIGTWDTTLSFTFIVDMNGTTDSLDLALTLSNARLIASDQTSWQAFRISD